MNVQTFCLSLFIAIGCLFMASAPAAAQDFVYRPKNPAFGGSPLNYQWLLNSAQLQNKYKKPTDFGLNQDPLANFKQSLQRQVLAELTRQIIQEKFGDNFDLSTSQTLKFGEFQVGIIPSGDGITVTIFDVTTGQETSITIPNI